jgi:hypothetical protein
MAVVINGTTGIDKVQDGSIGTADIAADAITTPKIANSVNLGRRNIIINGNMQIAQRNVNGSDTGKTASQYGPPDRFKCRTHASAGTLTLAHSSDAPVGFNRSYRITVTTPGTITGTESLRIDTLIEAQELVGLQHGTAAATGFTISFWAKSSTTGTYALNVYQYDGAEMVNQTYTINAADTWEYKTISFSGNTGTAIDNNNGAGFEIAWFLSSGPNIGTASSSLSNWTSYTTAAYGAGHTANISAVTNGYFAITGVQMEIGSIATPFEHRRAAEELVSCQRYYYRHSDFDDRKVVAQSYRTTATDVEGVVTFPTTMRTGPSLVATTGTNYYRDYWANNGTNLSTVTAGELGIQTAILRWTGHSRAATDSGYMRTNNAGATIDFDAEM